MLCWRRNQFLFLLKPCRWTNSQIFQDRNPYWMLGKPNHDLGALAPMERSSPTLHMGNLILMLMDPSGRSTITDLSIAWRYNLCFRKRFSHSCSNFFQHRELYRYLFPTFPGSLWCPGVYQFWHHKSVQIPKYLIQVLLVPMTTTWSQFCYNARKPRVKIFTFRNGPNGRDSSPNFRLVSVLVA